MAPGVPDSPEGKVVEIKPSMDLANNLPNESVYSLDFGSSRFPKAYDGNGVNVELAGNGGRFDLRALDLPTIEE